jgi:hypothetical protein
MGTDNNLSVFQNNPVKYMPSLDYCIEFDGLGTCISTFANYYMQNDFTIEVWIKDFGNQINPQGGHNYIFFNYFVRLSIYQNGAFDWVTMVYPFFNDMYLYYVNIPALDTSAWTHIVCRFTKAGFKKEIFVNGVLRATSAISALPTGPNGDLDIGATSGTQHLACYKGKMDELRLYTRAISDEEIAYSYNNGLANFPQDMAELANWYSFNRRGRNSGYMGSQSNGRLLNFIGNPYKLRNE